VLSNDGFADGHVIGWLANRSMGERKKKTPPKKKSRRGGGGGGGVGGVPGARRFGVPETTRPVQDTSISGDKQSEQNHVKQTARAEIINAPLRHKYLPMRASVSTRLLHPADAVLKGTRCRAAIRREKEGGPHYYWIVLLGGLIAG